MRAPSILVSLGVAALLLGCQSVPSSQPGTINDIPSNNPTATSTGLADG